MQTKNQSTRDQGLASVVGMIMTCVAFCFATSPTSVAAAPVNPQATPLAPGFSWAKQAGDVDGYGNFLYSMAVDSSGNSVVVGEFFSDTAQFFGSSLTDPMPSGWFVAKYDGAGNVLWAESVGQNTILTSAAFDASGNIFVSGTVYGATTLGTNSLDNNGDGALLVAKLDASGNVLWAKQPTGAAYSLGATLGVDAAGAVYVPGAFWSNNIVFGAGAALTLKNSGNAGGILPEDAFVAKYDKTGKPLWAKQVAVSYESKAYYFGGIGVDGLNNTYVFGSFNSAGSFANLAPFNNDGTKMFLSKYGPAGALLWVKTIVGTGFVYPEGLAVDSTGNCYLSGFFTPSNIKFGTITLNNLGGGHDIFLAKYNTAGVPQWAKGTSGESWDNDAAGVAVDGAGNVYQAGYFDSPTLTVAGNVVTNTSLFGSIYASKFDSLGNLVWTEQSNSTNGFAITRGMGVDLGGNVYVAGELGLANNVFGDVVLDESSAYNVFLTRIEGPQLSLDVVNNKLVLSWPTSATGLKLQSAPNTPNGVWTAVATTPAVTNHQYVVTSNVPNPSRKYRLKGGK